MEITIRLALSGESQNVFDFVNSVASETRVDWTSVQVQEELASEQAQVFVLEKEGAIRGCLFAREILPNEWEIRNLAVSKPLRRQGLAQKLLLRLFNSIPQRPARVFLEAAEANSAAIRLYEKMGAKKLYPRKNLYGDEDGWVFVFEIK